MRSNHMATERGDDATIKNKNDLSSLSKFVNKAADGGITAFHMATLNGYFDCVQLSLYLHANVSSVTSHYGASMVIGAGNTPLHYAACGRWLPVDVARMWGCHWLEPVLT